MYLNGFTNSDLERMLGVPSQEQSTNITAGSSFTEELRRAIQEKLNLKRILSSWEETGIPTMVKEMQCPPRAKRKCMQLTAPYPRGGAATEAILNAIEHGSSFGEKGPVTVQLKCNPSGFLLTVDDPSTGFTETQFKNARTNGESGRGNGLVQLNRCPVLVSFGHTRDHFRVSLLHTLRSN